MPAQLILLNPSKPRRVLVGRGVPRSTVRLGSAVRRAVAESKVRSNPSSNRKESKMAKHRKNPSYGKRKNPSRRKSRRNPDAPAGKKSRRPRKEVMAERLSKVSGAFTADQMAALMAALAPSRAPRAPRVSRSAEELRAIRLAAAAKGREKRMANRLAAIEAAGGETAYRAGQKARGAQRAAERGAIPRQVIRGVLTGQLSSADVRRLVKTARGSRGGKGAAKRLQSQYVAVMRGLRSGRIGKRVASLAGGRIEDGWRMSKVPKGQKAGISAKLARTYMAAKKLTLGLRPGTPAHTVAKQFGLTSLPNSGGIVKTFTGDFVSGLPMVALGAAGLAAVGWGLSKVVPMVAGKLPESVRKFAPPVLAYSIGIAGAALMKQSPKTAKYSGAVAGAGMAIAALGVLNAVKMGDKSLAATVAPGVLTLGEYHMGEYHMGDYDFTPTIGDSEGYRVGAPGMNVDDASLSGVEEVSMRRLQAPRGQPMPRHDTRRDSVDPEISQFSGTLAGDMFDGE
jgi:hypothetical protein